MNIEHIQFGREYVLINSYKHKKVKELAKMLKSSEGKIRTDLKVLGLYEEYLEIQSEREKNG